MSNPSCLVNVHYISRAFPESGLARHAVHDLYLEDFRRLGVAKTHAFFDIDWVERECPALMKVRIKDLDALVVGRFPLISGSCLFMPMWYLGKTGRTLEKVQSPLLDFLRQGVFLGLSPHPLLTGTEPIEAPERDTFWQDPVRYLRLQRDDSMLHASALAWLYGESETFDAAVDSLTAYQTKDLPNGRWWFNPEIILGDMSLELSNIEKFTRILDKIVNRSS